MKKNVIALLLATVMMASSIGSVPAMAAETTAQEAAEIEEETVVEEEPVSENEEGTTVNEAEPDSENVENSDEGTTMLEPEMEKVGEETSKSQQDSEEELPEESAPEVTNNENADYLEETADADEDGDIIADDTDESANDVEEEAVENATVNPKSASNVEVIGGQYYFYTYATTYGNLSFNVTNDTYCSVVQGNTVSGGGYYYYKLHLYPKDGGKNTIIEVRDNDSGQNIDLIFVHSNYQEADAQTKCIGKTVEVSFETINEIDQSNVFAGYTGSDSSVSYTLNSIVFDSALTHGVSIPRTYKYIASISLYTVGTYTINLTNSSDYTTLVKIPVTVTEHDYDDGVISSNATCQQKAVVTRTCNICGDTISEEVGELADHTWSDEYTVDKEATCTEEGSKSRHCLVCDTMTDVIPIPANGHVWNEEYIIDKEANCVEEGSESIHCSVCNAIDESTTRVIPKKEHVYGDWTVTKEATCTESGSKEKACVNCGDKVIEEIPATGHVWNEEYTVDKEATCIEDGSESIHCSICDAIDETTVRAIPKREHAYGNWTIIKEPTCTEAGSKEKVCADCGDKVTEEIPAVGHVWNEAYTVDKEATCIEDGSESIHCSVCGVIDESTARAIPMKGHAYGDWTVTVEPTCTEAGSKEKTCANCGDKVTESIPASGHVWDDKYTVDMDATCEMEGSESIHCSVCGLSDVSTAIAIPALGHAYGDWTVTTEATCTQNGIAETQCVNCGHVMMTEIPATGHIWNEEYTVDKEATCTEEGTESVHCSVCDTIDDTTIREIAKKDHAYGDWTVTKEATCTEAGSKEKVCANCGDKVTEEISAAGHQWNESYTVDVAPTYTEEGVESIHCSVCGEIQEGSERAVAKLLKPVSLLTISGIVNKPYNGEAQTQDVVVMDGNTTLVNGTDYTISYENNIDEGTASVIVTGIGNYTGTAVVEFKIFRITLEGKYLEISGIVGKTYNGKPQLQNVVVTYYGTTLEEWTDYGVIYRDNTNVGQATVIIVGLGKYKGTIVRYFWISKAPNTITAKNSTRTYSTKAQTFALGVKIKDGTPTYKSSSKSVTVSKEGKVTVKAKFIGKATITITAPEKTNYSKQTKKITITVNPTKTALSSVTSPSAGKMTVKWKKNAVGTGYQIQYSTSSKFTSSKLVTITKNTTLTKTIGSLAKGKKYYVRIRTYKTVGSKKFYSGWSAAKAVTIKK